MKRALLIFLLGFAGQAFSADVLHLYNWSNYLSDETARRFEVYCKCRLVQEYYGDNQEMLARLAAGSGDIDLVVPTGFALQSLIHQGLVQKLDSSRLPNFKNLAPAYLNLFFDPGNQYSVPYGMTSTLIGVNPARLQARGLSGKQRSWALIFDPALLSKIKGRVMVLDSPRELLSAALMYLGRPATSVDPADWYAARDVIIRAKPYWAGFSNQSYLQQLAQGNVDVVQGYSSDMVQARQGVFATSISGGWLAFELQREGNVLSLDSLAVLKAAPRKDLAYKFINFLLDGRNAAALSNEIGSGNPNRAALKYIRPQLLHNEAVFPGGEQLQRLRQLHDLTPAQQAVLAKIWSQIKLS